jgi:hypothetical protein
MKIKFAMPQQRNPLAWTLVIFAGAALVACNAGSSASTAADKAAAPTIDSAAVDKAIRASGIITSRNACDLLGRSDAEAAVGQPLPQNTVKNIALGMCDYNATDFSAGASLTVGSWDSVKNAATGGPHQPDPISGVGDEALSLRGLLYVRRGDEGFMVEVHGPKSIRCLITVWLRKKSSH